jgi:cyclase
MLPTDLQAETPKLIAVADGVVVRQEVDNIAFVSMGGFGVVIDALERPELRDEVMAALDEVLAGQPLRYVLNTHTHYDHVALNDDFRRQGAEILNASTRPAGAAGFELSGSRRRLKVLPMPGAHTDEDWVVWLPDDAVLFVGDIFGWGVIPLVTNLRADTLARLDDIIARLISFDARVVVPGHGPLAATADLLRWGRYLHWLIDAIRPLAADGLEDREILARTPPPDDMRHWWRLLKWKHADSVAKIAKSLRKGWL